MNVHATRGRKRGTRQTYSIVCDPALIAALEEMVTSGVYRSRSHAIESAVRLLIAYHCRGNRPDGINHTPRGGGMPGS